MTLTCHFRTIGSGDRVAPVRRHPLPIGQHCFVPECPEPVVHRLGHLAEAFDPQGNRIKISLPRVRPP